MLKKFFKILSFLLAVVILLGSSYFILDFKYTDSIYKFDMFYKQEEDTVDVLVLGSSHAYQGINTAVLWEEYGYPAYNLGGAAQPIWNTYYYLEEALKTQTPKVIILDTYTLHYSTDYGETSFAIKNTYGLKWSETKIDAIKASFSEETVNQYFFEILQYHSRYSDLGRADFYPYQGNKTVYENHKGFYCYFNSEPVTDNHVEQVLYLNKMTEKVEMYYRMIIGLAKEKNIPLIITAIPFAAENYHQGFFNTGKAIAEEYGVPFYNFLSDYKAELALDYETDFSDTQHLNYLGNTKLTHFFGDLLRDEYNLPDRRGDSRYASWEADAEIYYDRLDNHTVTYLPTLGSYIYALRGDRYKIIMTETLGEDEKMSDKLKTELNPIFSSVGIAEDEYAAGGMWIIENGQSTYYNDCKKENFSKTVRLSSSSTALVKTKTVETQAGKQYNAKSILVNKKDYTAVTRGINIYVYDTKLKTAVDAVSYNFNSGKFSHN